MSKKAASQAVPELAPDGGSGKGSEAAVSRETETPELLIGYMARIGKGDS